MVGNEKFHVRRVLLSINSPVFKAMFKSGFQEATKNEIPLPGKKANEVLDFLKQFYVQEREEITSKSVHVFKKDVLPTLCLYRKDLHRNEILGVSLLFKRLFSYLKDTERRCCAKAQSPLLRRA